MSKGLYVALGGAVAQQVSVETVATNLANAATDGYQKLRPIFHEVLMGSGEDGQTLRMTEVSRTAIDGTGGALKVTGRGLDIAIAPGSYLAVETSAGERYTRAGALSVSADGTLKTTRGDIVLGDTNKPIKVQPNGTEVKAVPSGEIMQAGSAVGRLKLVKFANPDQLTHEGGTRLAGSPGAGTPTASTAPIEVGSIEESNTSVVGAMTELVTATRNFEAFQKCLETFRDVDRRVVTTVPNAG